MGIDQRFTAKIAERLRNRRGLETCTGGGFTTVALARVATHVITVEIDPVHHAQAKQNVATAGLLDRVTLVLADIMEEEIWDRLPRVDAAFLDPDWAVTGPIISIVFGGLQPGPPLIYCLSEYSVPHATSPLCFRRVWTSTNLMQFQLTSARSSIWTRITNSTACTLVASSSR